MKEKLSLSNPGSRDRPVREAFMAAPKPEECPPRVKAWFKPENDADLGDPERILKEAYQKAEQFNRDQARKNRKYEFPLSKSSTMDSVLDEVRKAEEQLIAKKNSRHRFTKAMGLAWITAVEKINTFSTAIDVLVSSHPEYAALVWGSMKFLFLVTLNHQELASKILEAFCAISEALPEVNFLASELYPIPRMQSTLATIYTHIIDFCSRAVRWYNKTRGSFIRKTLAAIKDPWALEFDDVVRQIHRTTARIREQAAVAHQAETRYVSSLVSQVKQEVLELKVGRNVYASSHGALLGGTTLSPLDQPSLMGRAPLVIKEMAKYFFSVPFKPEKALDLGITLRDRRRRRGNPIPDQLWTSVKLRNWISQLGSALVQVQGNLVAADASRDFALDIVELAKGAGLPLAWYISSQLEEPMAVLNVWRSLVWQVLEQNLHSSSYKNLTESNFNSCTTEDDWISLLVAVLAEIPRVILVIDSHQDERKTRETVRKFWNTFTERKVATTVKMLLLTYSNPGTPMPSMLPNDDVEFYSLRMGHDRRPGMARALIQEHHHGLFKTSAGLIAGIGLATVLAHKVWPKGVLYGDAEEWESRPHPKHRHSDRHEHHRRHRRASDAERAIERARRHGDVVYYEEIGPFPGRRRSAALQSYERLSPAEEERIRRMSRDENSRVGRLPYPDEPYPGESFYEPEPRRHSVAQPVTVPR
ncbi:hypothetical protein CEP51_012478 [Fusarium floridanum]|uniref:DUF7708 domain-containing protein n=1 Tax=Fusarium floridanum TaxID=1325733 RepID=A0A428QTG7_9HYPO|nr:hypothetical protein CEP51_012478 [Fusarium floridanum]